MFDKEIKYRLLSVGEEEGRRGRDAAPPGLPQGEEEGTRRMK